MFSVLLSLVLSLLLSSSSSAAPQSNGSGSAEEAAWKNTWSWNLTDSSFGHLLLDVREGRVSAELKSQGASFGFHLLSFYFRFLWCCRVFFFARCEGEGS